MKPMILLISFGVITTAITLIIALKHHDGVVTNSKYVDGINYDNDQAFKKEYRKDIEFNGFEIDNNSMILKASFAEDKLPVAVILKAPIKKNAYTFKNDNGTFIYDSLSSINKGWYNLELVYLNNERSVPVVFSYYHEK